MKDTRIELVAELEEIRLGLIRLADATPGDNEYADKLTTLNFIIMEAKSGEFHDFKNQKYACGKQALVICLRSVGLEGIAERVINGEYDEKPDGEDIAQMRKTTPRRLWAALGLDREE